MIKKIIKSVYNIIPLKREFFSVVKRVVKLPPRIFKHLHFKGTLSIKVMPNVFFKIQHYGYQIENELFWQGLYGGWERDSMRLWVELSKEAKVIFDIGANTGVYSLVAKSVNPSAELHAFEPIKRVYEKLVNNIGLNKYEIHTNLMAVSSATGEGFFYDSGDEHLLSVTINQEINTDGVKQKVNLTSLDDYTRLNQIQHIDLIKIDVETHEPDVIRGFKEGLSKWKPTLLIEVLSDEVADELQPMLNNLGYFYFNIDEKGNILRQDKLTKSGYYNFLVCQPSIAAKLGLS